LHLASSFARYVGRRIVFAAILVLVVSSASLVLARLAPGDYAQDLLGPGADPAAVARARARYGLDQPVLTQYGRWISRVVRLDFGTSYLYGRGVTEIVRERAANTAVLAATALGLATLIGIPLGVFTGSRPNGILPALVRGSSVFLQSAPPLVTSLALVFFASRTGWLPVGGMTSVDTSAAGLAAWLADVGRHLPVPALALALPLAAMLERLQSQATREAADQPCIRAARARGVSPARLIWRHALRLAAPPVAAVFGLVLGILFSGSFIVEVVTAWPGLGRLMYDALRARDVYLVAGVATAGALFSAAGTLVSDVAVALLDPRVGGEAT
jgi:peptide/nickel transport system permease protein